MLKIKTMISNFIWRICRISPNMGNRVMDFIGYENYCKVAKCQTLSKKI